LAQIAFEAGLSPDGKAWMQRCRPAARAASTASFVAAVAMPRPWASGSTDQPIS